MSTVNAEYAQVCQQIKQWPTDWRQSLAGEILQSLEADLGLFNGEWNEAKNARRCELIDREIDGTLTTAERVELDVLQKQAVAYRDRVAPLPMEGARKLHQELLERKRRDQQS